MKLYVNNQSYLNEVKTFLKVYVKTDKIELVEQLNGSHIGVIVEENTLSVQMLSNEALYKSSYTKAELEGFFIGLNEIEIRKKNKYLLKQLIYDLFCEAKGIRPPWGILTGIRPTKVLLKLLSQGKTIEEAKEVLMMDYRISEEKVDLMLAVAEKEALIISENREGEINLYIGIPFCPSKCLYCSFTSYSIDKYKDRIKDYLNALEKELSYFSKNILKRYALRTIYIGGGTPTSLDEDQLKTLMKLINQHIDITDIDEFTVEAGRPDTISRKKLETLKTYGVDRISINPQTMNEETLKLIGRNHTTKEIIKSYELAREIGFKTINMDLILGLNNEVVEDAINTLDAIEGLDPENVTIHTLAIKRASRLKEDLDHYHLSQTKVIEDMLSASVKTMQQMELNPYYLYRQKNMLGNFENVGYAKVGHECIYNVEIIEEKSTIYAIGAGAVTKLVNPETGKITRIENVKNIDQYIERIHEMIERKSKI